MRGVRQRLLVIAEIPKSQASFGQGLRVSGYVFLHLPVLRLRQLGKLSNKGNDVPYFVILERLAVGRHAGHFDPVLDDPEQLGIGPPPRRYQPDTAPSD